MTGPLDEDVALFQRRKLQDTSPWVLNDLEAMGVPHAAAFDYQPSHWLLGLMGYNYWSAERRHPCSALGMVYALEVIASVYGGPITTAIMGDFGAAMRGPAATLLLALWGRVPLSDVDVIGDASAAERLVALGFRG